MTTTSPWYSSGLPARTAASTVTIDGADIAYWTYDSVHHGPQTRTVLVIHGFRGDHHGLLRVADALPEHRLIMPDLPGFGSSSAFPQTPHDIPAFVRFIHAFLAALNLGPDTVLLGHSFGSIVASHFVAANPGSVERLILINPIAAPALEGPKGLMTRLAVLYYRLAARLPERPGLALLRNPLIVRVMSAAMAKTHDRDLRRFIHGQHHSYFSVFANRNSLLESFRASVSSNVLEVAQDLELPVLLIAGEVDEIAQLKDQHRLLARLPNAEMTVIPGVGHLIHYETPEPAARSIRDFLAGPAV